MSNGIKTFVEAMIEYFSESTEMDGADFQEMGVKHGIFEERPATQADIDEYDYNEYDVEVGDTIYVSTALLNEPSTAEAKLKKVREMLKHYNLLVPYDLSFDSSIDHDKKAAMDAIRAIKSIVEESHHAK